MREYLCESLIKQDIETWQKQREAEIEDQFQRYGLIAYVKNEISCTWTNGSDGMFRYSDNNYLYGFCKKTKELQLLITETELPVIACGFVAYLIHNFGDSTEDIFSGYLNTQMYRYETLHNSDPDVLSRSLRAEFFSAYENYEKSLITQSKKIFEFLTKKETDLINNYIDVYLKFISNSYDYSIYLINGYESIKSNLDGKEKPQPEITDPTKGNDNTSQSKKFINYLHHANREALLAKLHELIDGNKGKSVSIVIIALIELNFIAGYDSRNNLYQTMRDEFGYIGADSGLNKYFDDKDPKIKKELDVIINILKAVN